MYTDIQASVEYGKKINATVLLFFDQDYNYARLERACCIQLTTPKG